MKDRRSVRIYRKNKEKELLRLYRKYDELRDAARTPVEVEILDKPLKVGYSRTFVLNAIGLSQKNVNAIKEALEVCNDVQFSRERTFKDVVWVPNYLSVHASYHFGHSSNKELKLVSIHETTYEKLSESAKALFERCEESFSPWAGRTIYRYEPVGIKLSWLKIKIKPEYITEYKKYDNEVQSERDKLYNYLTSNDYFHKIYHMIYGASYRDKWYKEKRKYDKRGERKRENDLLKKI